MATASARRHLPTPEAFRAARVAAGETQNEAANRISADRSTLQAFEGGFTTRPTIAVAAGIVHAYRHYVRKAA